MAQYAPLRDAFGELNRLLIDKQQWDANHEVRMGELGLKKAMLESQLQDQAQQRVLQQRKVMEAEAQMKPTEVNLYNFAPQNPILMSAFQRDPSLPTKIAKSWGGDNMDLATGKVLDANGSPVVMPAFEAGQKSMAAMALVVGSLDPAMAVQQEQAQLASNIASVNQELKGIPDLPVNSKTRGDLKQKLSALQGQLKQAEGRKSPEKMIDLYNQQMKAMQSFSTEAVSLGANNEFLSLVKGHEDNINRQILNLQNEIWQRQREDRTANRASREPILKMAHEIDSQGKPTGKSVAMFIQKGQFTNKGVTPNQIDPSLGENYVWGEPGTEGPKTPTNYVSHHNSVDKTRLLAFGKEGKNPGDIIIDPSMRTAADMSNRLAATQLPQFYNSAKPQEVFNTPPVALAEAINAEVKAALSDYFVQQYKLFTSEAGGEERDATEKLMLPFAKKFQEKWGTLPSWEENPLLRSKKPNARLRVGPEARVAPGDVGEMLESGDLDLK